MWDTDTCEHERKFIMNDYGFSKVDITRGEDIEERIEFMKFSNNKKEDKSLYYVGRLRGKLFCRKRESY